VNAPVIPFEVLHTEKMRVAWVDTDAGGRIHWSACFGGQNSPNTLCCARWDVAAARPARTRGGQPR
jgi:hypothetical protein